jgi:Trypsin-like peptidase domain
MALKLLSGVGTVMGLRTEPLPGSNLPWRFLGTCFAYREPWFFLTAAHCIEGFAAEDLGVDAPGKSGTGHPIREVNVLDGVDLAVLRAPDRGAWMSSVDPYRDIQHEYEIAQDFVSFGFPAETVETRANQPVAQIFKGHFVQLLLQFADPWGRSYVASEMSIPAPEGLSGAPVYSPAQPYVVTAMVTGEKSTFTIPERVEEEAGPGQVRVTEVRRQISYGVALMLHPYAAWIEEQLSAGPAQADGT